MSAVAQIHHKPTERSPEHVWGMALHGLLSAVSDVHAMAQQDAYRDLAASDFDKINEATLALNLTWSQLKARNAA